MDSERARKLVLSSQKNGGGCCPSRLNSDFTSNQKISEYIVSPILDRLYLFVGKLASPCSTTLPFIGGQDLPPKLSDVIRVQIVRYSLKPTLSRKHCCGCFCQGQIREASEVVPDAVL